MSHETIYQMIYQNYQGMGIYAQNLRQSQRQRQRRGQQQPKRGVMATGKAIPASVVIISVRSLIGRQKLTGCLHMIGIGGNHLGAITDRLRKSLDYSTPHEVFSSQSGSVLQTWPLLIQSTNRLLKALKTR